MYNTYIYVQYVLYMVHSLYIQMASQPVIHIRCICSSIPYNIRTYNKFYITNSITRCHETISNVIILWACSYCLYCKAAIYQHWSHCHTHWAIAPDMPEDWCPSSDCGIHLKLRCGEELLLHQGQRCHAPMVREVISPSHSIHSARDPLVGKTTIPFFKFGIMWGHFTHIPEGK